MSELKTPSEWTIDTVIYSRSAVSNNYNFDRAVYSDIPSARIKLCWQPVDDSTTVKERGEVTVSSYAAVVYDDVKLKRGDMVEIDGLGVFYVSEIKKYITHRFVTVVSTDRRISDV